MSTYPSCKHGFNDPNGSCPTCESEDRVYKYETALNMILKAKCRGLGIDYAEGVARQAMFGEKHTMKASPDDADTCDWCGLNFRNPIHYRVGEK